MTDSSNSAGNALTLHATTVAIDGKAVLIRGASGCGKSALGLRLIALGAQLVADDRTQLCLAPPPASAPSSLPPSERTKLIASAPDTISGLIEARHVGLLRCPAFGPAPLYLVVDLDHAEPDRLPPERSTEILGVELPLILGAKTPHLAEAVILWVRHTRFA